MFTVHLTNKNSLGCAGTYNFLSTIPPPQTIEPALTELTHDNPDQDVTWTHGLKPHSVTTTDPPPEPPQQTTISNPHPHVPPTPTNTPSQEPGTSTAPKKRNRSSKKPNPNRDQRKK